MPARIEVADVKIQRLGAPKAGTGRGGWRTGSNGWSAAARAGIGCA